MVMQIHSNYLARAGGFSVAERVSDGEQALAALERIEQAQAAQREQLAALAEKLRAAGGALAG